MRRRDLSEEDRIALNRRKTGDRSPMLGRHKLGNGKDGLIEAQHVTVYWDFGPDCKSVRNLSVVYCPRTVMTSRDFDIWRDWDTFDCVMGNCCTDWPEGRDARGNPDFENCPAGLFGHLLAYGFTDKDEITRALREFAHIKECPWAREMLWIAPHHPVEQEHAA
jgi:hypothetical protein